MLYLYTKFCFDIQGVNVEIAPPTVLSFKGSTAMIQKLLESAARGAMQTGINAILVGNALSKRFNAQQSIVLSVHHLGLNYSVCNCFMVILYPIGALLYIFIPIHEYQ